MIIIIIQFNSIQFLFIKVHANNKMADHIKNITYRHKLTKEINSTQMTQTTNKQNTQKTTK
jgi:hypothetical protein